MYRSMYLNPPLVRPLVPQEGFVLLTMASWISLIIISYVEILWNHLFFKTKQYTLYTLRKQAYSNILKILPSKMKKKSDETSDSF